MSLPRITVHQQATYDPEVDAAYLYLAGDINDGAATTQRTIDVPGVGEVILDFDIEGRLLGLEVLTASALLPRKLLDRLTADDDLHSDHDNSENRDSQNEDEAHQDSARDFAPIHAAHGPVADWLDARGPHAVALADRIAWSPTFSEQSFPAGTAEVEQLWTTGGWVSWLGGPAVAPLAEWPHTAAGLPLAHVMTICLEDLHSASDAAGKASFPLHAEGLPTSGALEVFHDLATWGWQSSDGDAAAGEGGAGGWLVRWVPQPDRSTLVHAPDTTALDGYPTAPVCQAGTFLLGWTLPPPADAVGARSAVFEVAEELAREHARTWCHQRHVPFWGQVDGPTHVYGHGSRSSAAATQVLDTVLPLKDDDHHRLLVEVESDTHLAGWFADRGHLQVWMRASDLAAGRFEAAWCLVRTD